MGNLTKGTAYIYGIPDEVKPIHGLPRGKMRLRLRPKQWAKVFVRSENSIVGFHLVNCGSHWNLGAKVWREPPCTRLNDV